ISLVPAATHADRIDFALSLRNCLTNGRCKKVLILPRLRLWRSPPRSKSGNGFPRKVKIFSLFAKAERRVVHRGPVMFPENSEVCRRAGSRTLFSLTKTRVSRFG